MSLAPIVVLDACVLYPAPLRDLLMYLQLHGLIQARWSDRIHEEWMTAVQRVRPDLERGKLERTRALMEKNALDANVSDYEEIEARIAGLPDPHDAHIVAVGIKSGASRIVTYNLKDFPAWLSEIHEISAVHPDLLFKELLEAMPEKFLDAVREHRARLVNPPKSGEQYLETLEDQRLFLTVRMIRDFRGVV